VRKGLKDLVNLALFELSASDVEFCETQVLPIILVKEVLESSHGEIAHLIVNTGEPRHSRIFYNAPYNAFNAHVSDTVLSQKKLLISSFEDRDVEGETFALAVVHAIALEVEGLVDYLLGQGKSKHLLLPTELDVLGLKLVFVNILLHVFVFAFGENGLVCFRLSGEIEY